MTTKHHLPQSAPFYDTSIPMSRTRLEISEMLLEGGAKAIRWTDTEKSIAGRFLPRLEFVLDARVGNESQKFLVRYEVPMTVLTHSRSRRGRLVTKARANPNGTMRMLYWLIRDRLIAAKFGVEDHTEGFLSRIVYPLPPGQEMKDGARDATIAEIIKEKPEVLSPLLPGFQIVWDTPQPQKQLESVPEAESRVMREVVEVAAELVEEQEKKE